MNTPQRQIVLDFLKLYSVKTAENGKLFDLSSGQQSSIYLDVKKTILHNRIHMPLAALIYDALNEFYPIDCVGGVVLGGCHLASITAMYSSFFDRPLGTVYIRKNEKAHGTKELIEKPACCSSIVLLEDVITTGESVFKAAEILRESSFDVRGIICVVDRRQKYEQYLRGQIPVKSLFKLEDLFV